MKIVTAVSILLTTALATVSYYGAFIPGTYQREVLSLAAQGIGQDIFDLFIIVPLLLILLRCMHKGYKTAFFIFSGTILYVLYSFFIYCFGVHFNRFFLLYCLVLGSAFYTFILSIHLLLGLPMKGWPPQKAPVRMIGGFFLTVALMFYLLWLKEVGPAIMQNGVPKSVIDYHLLVNPVHVMDMAVVLPGLIITAVLLMRKRQMGFIFAPVFLTFIVLQALALLSMVIVLQVKGINEDLSIAFVFALLAVLSGIQLFFYVKAMKPEHQPTG